MSIFKYISLKFLSFFGYIYFIFYLIYKFTGIFLLEDIINIFIYIFIFMFIIELFIKSPPSISNFRKPLSLKRRICNILFLFGILLIIINIKWHFLILLPIILTKLIINNPLKNLMYNLLSCLGYFIFIVILIFHFSWHSEASAYSINNIDPNFMIISYFGGFMELIKIYYFIIAILLYLSLIEFVIRKNFKNLIFNFSFPNKMISIYQYFFYIGILFAFSPFLYFLLISLNTFF